MIENTALKLTPYQRDIVVAALTMYAETLLTLERDGTYSGINRERLTTAAFLLGLLGAEGPA